MGVSLGYRTTKPVSATVKQAILADAERVNRERDWWCESIIFFEARGRNTKGPSPLTGDTKPHFSNFVLDGEDCEIEIDLDDDLFMGYRDTAFIVQQLVRWSREHGVDWILEMAGADLGTITNGVVQSGGLFNWHYEETQGHSSGRRGSIGSTLHETSNHSKKVG